MAVNLGTRGLPEAIELLEYANHPQGTELSDTAHRARRQGAAQHPDVVPGQRDGRALAARPQDRPTSTDGSPRRRRAPCASSTATWSSSPAAAPAAPCRRSARGRRPSWSTPMTSWTSSRLTPTTSSRATTSPASSRRRSTWTGSSSEAVATADHVGAKLSTPKKINISFDEWNVWYLRELQVSGMPEDWTVAPRLSEDAYTVARRRRGRVLAHHPAQAQRPRDRRLPGPAGQHDQRDPLRAGRAGVAAVDLPPVRADRPARPGQVLQPQVAAPDPGDDQARRGPRPGLGRHLRRRGRAAWLCSSSTGTRRSRCAFSTRPAGLRRAWSLTEATHALGRGPLRGEHHGRARPGACRSRTAPRRSWASLEAELPPASWSMFVLQVS